MHLDLGQRAGSRERLRACASCHLPPGWRGSWDEVGARRWREEDGEGGQGVQVTGCSPASPLKVPSLGEVSAGEEHFHLEPEGATLPQPRTLSKGRADQSHPGATMAEEMWTNEGARRKALSPKRSPSVPSILITAVSY